MLYEPAHAKINLFLDVISKRPDGYHNLKSCMQTVGLADTISASLRDHPTGQSIELTCSNEKLACDRKNLAYRSAEAFFSAAKIESYELKMHIEKRIPLSAGLGGGSADAAAVLRMLNKYYDFPLSTAEIVEIGASLGSDVPFCIHGGTCHCVGVGDILTPVLTQPDYTVLVAKNGEGISTPEAFSLLDQKYSDFTNYQPPEHDRIYEALSCGNVHALHNATYNIFEDVIFPIRPESKRLKEFMLDRGAICAQMSGSGPSVFGIFVSDARAELCAAMLRQEGIFAVACRTVSAKI